MSRPVIIAIFVSACLPFLFSAAAAEPIIADHQAAADFNLISAEYFDQVRANYKMFYGHSSHGSQIITGLNELENENPLYTSPTFYEYGDDLGHNGDTSWVPPTRSWLDGHADYNLAIWSWCGGCSDNTEEGINIYLNAMNQLESDYPDVIFIYMTGHLDGGGPGGNLYARNNQIRAYCTANDKILFDFADIESYDPDGAYYPNGGDGCEWCFDWCGDPQNNCADDCDCAHSHCFNCYLKGKAFWWMMARIEGWNGAQPVDEDNTLPTKILFEQNHPNPFNSSTMIRYFLPSAAGVKIDIFDLLGRKVETLINRNQAAGYHQITWIAKNMPSGIYFYRIQTGDYSKTMKMVLLR